MDGNAIVYCERLFGKTDGKTANGLVRFTKRYNVLCIIDSTQCGNDAGEVLDGKRKNIPIVASLNEALQKFAGQKPKYFIIGIAPSGGKLPSECREVVLNAIKSGLNIDSGLHTFLSDDKEFSDAATKYDVVIRDIRKPPTRENLHFFTGEIKNVKALKIAMLGTDSAIGKRTTSVLLTNMLNNFGIKTEMIGTGQTAWMQGWEFSIVLDSLINDFVSGEIEHAVVSAWKAKKPQVIIIEGQGCLTNPAFPGGFEILAAARPDLIILQHAPKRKYYDGFPDFPIAGIEKESEIIKLLTDKNIFAIAINHEEMSVEETKATIYEYDSKYGIPCFDPLSDDEIFGIKKIIPYIEKLL